MSALGQLLSTIKDGALVKNESWSSAENDAIVADYMTMLASDLAGHRYNKAQHNRELQSLVGRSKGSIEFKHQNISAVLAGAGEPWIPGYKPAFNYQSDLENAVARWFAKRPDWTAVQIGTQLDIRRQPNGALPLHNAPSLQTGKTEDDKQLARIARRFDPAERDQKNRQLGRAGEERAFFHEIATLKAAGCGDLAKKVRWVSAEDGDGLGYDILSFDPTGAERLIEVKTTNGFERTPFYLTRNEIAVAVERPAHWRLFRLWDFARNPRAFELTPPLEDSVTLTSMTFSASFGS